MATSSRVRALLSGALLALATAAGAQGVAGSAEDAPPPAELEPKRYVIERIAILGTQRTQESAVRERLNRP